MQTDYDQIATSFSSTRYAIWKCVKLFIESLPKHQTLIDIGCGNGKYANSQTWFGCDLSIQLLQIAQTKSDKLVQASVTHLPYRDQSFDAAISIAVIHHLGPAERFKALKEIMRVTKHKALVTVWAREQHIKPKWKDMGNGDFLIPWQNTIMRYYHLFTKQEFEGLIQSLNHKYEMHFERDNWCAIIYKE